MAEKLNVYTSDGQRQREAAREIARGDRGCAGLSAPNCSHTLRLPNPETAKRP